MADSDIPEGYPDSPPEETTPFEPPVSLEAADRESEDEGEVNPEGAAPPGDDAEDAFNDANDADKLAEAEVGSHGSHHEDAANFEDNTAEWSRERS